MLVRKLINDYAEIFAVITVIAVVIAINFYVRHDVIVNETLIADDLIYISSAKQDECILSTRTAIINGSLCKIFNALPVYKGRLIYFDLSTT